MVQVTSAGMNAGNFAKITINDKLVKVHENENNHERGLHIVIINKLNGEVEYAEVFDTYKSSRKLDKFVKSQLPEGCIIVVACKDDCVTNLSMDGKMWLAAMGSSEIWRLDYR